jgi:CIC family chloride channel protein
MKKPRRILVGLKTLEHAVSLADLACRVGTRNASIFLVHVTELPDATPLDADVPDLDALAHKILTAGERVANRSGLKVTTRILRAHNAGTALLDEITERKIDLGIFGYHHRRTLGEILLGTAAQSIVRNAPCDILLAVPPREK